MPFPSKKQSVKKWEGKDIGNQMGRRISFTKTLLLAPFPVYLQLVLVYTSQVFGNQIRLNK